MLRASLFKLPTVVNFLSAIAAGALLALSMFQYRSVSDQIIRWKHGAVPHEEIYKQWLEGKKLRQAQSGEDVTLSQGTVSTFSESSFCMHSAIKGPGIMLLGCFITYLC